MHKMHKAISHDSVAIRPQCELIRYASTKGGIFFYVIKLTIFSRHLYDIKCTTTKRLLSMFTVKEKSKKGHL